MTFAAVVSHSHIYGLDQARKEDGRAATARSHKTTRTIGGEDEPDWTGNGRRSWTVTTRRGWRWMLNNRNAINGPTTD